MTPGRGASSTLADRRVRAARWLASAIAVAAIAACAGPGKPDVAQHTYKLYPGPARPQAELAVVELRIPVQAVRIDRLLVSADDYRIVELPPGEHHIAWEAAFGVSVMVNPAMQDSAALERTLHLAAGHRYLVRADRTYGQGYRMYLWIEDAKTGEVLAGTRKP